MKMENLGILYECAPLISLQIKNQWLALIK